MSWSSCVNISLTSWKTCQNQQFCLEENMDTIRLCHSLVHSRLCPLAENVWWLDLNFLSRKCVQLTYNYVPRMQLSDMFFACCLIGCVTLPSSSQQRSLAIEASVARESSGKFPDFSCQTWAKIAGHIFPSLKITNTLNLLVSRFVVAQYLKEQSADALSSLFCTKIANLEINLRWLFCTLMT